MNREDFRFLGSGAGGDLPAMLLACVSEEASNWARLKYAMFYREYGWRVERTITERLNRSHRNRWDGVTQAQLKTIAQVGIYQDLSSRQFGIRVIGALLGVHHSNIVRAWRHRLDVPATMIRGWESEISRALADYNWS